MSVSIALSLVLACTRACTAQRKLAACHRGEAEKLSYKQQFTRSRVLFFFSSFKLYHGTVYCGTFANLYAKALYYVSESTNSCTVAG